jgi:integrase
MKKLNDDQATAIYGFLKASIDPRDILIQCIFETGCRVSESLLLSPKSLSESGVITIEPLKSSKIRHLKISENLIGKFRKGSYVACLKSSSSKESQRRSLCRRFHWICEQVLGHRMKIHSLRHTAFSRLYAKTKDLLLVQEWAGHKSINSTLEYLKDHRRDEANAIMSQILEG